MTTTIPPLKFGFIIPEKGMNYEISRITEVTDDRFMGEYVLVEWNGIPCYFLGSYTDSDRYAVNPVKEISEEEFLDFLKKGYHSIVKW